MLMNIFLSQYSWHPLILTSSSTIINQSECSFIACIHILKVFLIWPYILKSPFVLCIRLIPIRSPALPLHTLFLICTLLSCKPSNLALISCISRFLLILVFLVKSSRQMLTELLSILTISLPIMVDNIEQ